jgi:hypothetical protein
MDSVRKTGMPAPLASEATDPNQQFSSGSSR